LRNREVIRDNYKSMAESANVRVKNLSKELTESHKELRDREKRIKEKDRRISELEKALDNSKKADKAKQQEEARRDYSKDFFFSKHRKK